MDSTSRVVAYVLNHVYSILIQYRSPTKSSIHENNSIVLTVYSGV
jgi:hypothetical protein